MAYLTIPLLVELFGEKEVSGLVDREREGIIGQPDPSQIIARAESTVDSFIGDVYEIPVISPPSWLIWACADIWRYYAHDQRATELVVERYQAALAALAEVANGLRSVDGAVLLADAGVQMLAPTDQLWPRTGRGMW